MKRYRRVLRKLNQKLIRPLPKCHNIDRQFQQLYDNLWSQFGWSPERRQRYRARNRLLPSVTDYAWTPEVQAAFYEHPEHRAFWHRVVKHRQQGMWILNAEPATYKRRTSA